MLYTQQYSSPIGDITLTSDGESLTGLWFETQRQYALALANKDESEVKRNITIATTDEECRVKAVFDITCRWLDLYFSGGMPAFSPPLNPSGTEFQKQVWEILLTIPYGTTATYAEIARISARIRGQATMAAQAIGSAVGHNPISIIIPCHRVIGSNGSLTGYAGGLDKKKALLDTEREGLRKAAQKEHDNPQQTTEK